jgi:hypothetical protein
VDVSRGRFIPPPGHVKWFRCYSDPVQSEGLSEDDRLANADAVDLFKLIEHDLGQRWDRAARSLNSVPTARMGL